VASIRLLPDYTVYTVVDYPRSGVFQGTSWILRDRRIGLPQICQQHPPCVSRIGKRKYHTSRRAALSYWYYKFSTVMNEHPRVRVVELAGLIPYVLVHTGISSNQMNESDGKPTATRKKSLRRGLRWPEGSSIAPHGVRVAGSARYTSEGKFHFTEHSAGLLCASLHSKHHSIVPLECKKGLVASCQVL